MRVAIQMDPIESIRIETDTSFAMGLEAQSRGHDIFVYDPRDLSLVEGRLFARGRRAELRPVKGDHAVCGPVERIALDTVDVVLMRQDPPFDLAYITATHLLELLPPSTLVVNDPAGVRNAPEKLLVAGFPELMPPTLISRDAAEIADFRARHKDIVVKPLFGHGGAGVFRIGPDDPNLGSLLELMLARGREPLMIQRFLPEIAQGDKRILLIEGEPLGLINRLPGDNSIRSNLAAGGRAEAIELSARDREICAAIGPTLRKMGLIFTGIDVIGGCLTEINVTSPTGLVVFKRLSGVDLLPALWDAIEARRR